MKDSFSPESCQVVLDSIVSSLKIISICPRALAIVCHLLCVFVHFLELNNFYEVSPSENS